MEAEEGERRTAAEYRRPYERILTSGQSRTYGSGAEYSIYRPNGEASFFADVYASSRGDGSAIERLRRNEAANGTEFRAGTTGSTSFGSFIPPVWLMDEIAMAARAGRVVPDLIGITGPPTSTSMTVPRITTGSATAIQATENSTVGTTDWVTAQLTRTTSTIAGYVDASLQSLELGSYATDQLVSRDLIADYNRAFIAVHYRHGRQQSTPRARQSDGFQRDHLHAGVAHGPAALFADRERHPTGLDGPFRQSGRDPDAPSPLGLLPRRVGHDGSSARDSGRPRLQPDGRRARAEGRRPGRDARGPARLYVGQHPDDAGAGTQDEIYVAKFSDMLAYESTPRVEVFRDIGSANATVRFRIYAFVNFFCGRFPAGVSRITGSGLIAPTW